MDVLEIDADTTLTPGRVYGPIAITRSGVTLDGQGAMVVGSTRGQTDTFLGTGIQARGISGVTLRNLVVKGFESGLRAGDGEGWSVEDCDFSDNFHDPDFDWGDNGRRGGIVLLRMVKSAFRRNAAHRVWDACNLVESHDNVIEENDFSHTSNTCLRLWESCRNEVRSNNLSYGIRITPGEVHARDSCCVLVEHWSHDNRFLRNDATHGGDGIFVRVLDGCPSGGNLLQGNDASYAHNNCFESAAPGNTYLENRANHGSYGFWMGCSDRTVMLGNEAGHNGLPDGSHNAPEPDFGHGGIVFVNGSAEHVLVQRNHCHHNNGGGIVLRGSADGSFRAFHWVIQENRLEANRWGIYLQRVSWIDLGPNEIVDSLETAIMNAGSVTDVTLPEQAGWAGLQSPKAVLRASHAVLAPGAAVALDATDSSDPNGLPLTFRWDLGDGSISDLPELEHAYAHPGTYTLGLTVSNGRLHGIDWATVVVKA